MNKSIKVGVLGCSSFALRAMIPSLISCEGMQLIAVASRSAEKAKVAAETYGCEGIVGYENLINRTDIQLIYMPLPTGLHVRWGMKALQSGKHLFVEKSFAPDYETAKMLVKEAERNNLLVIENFLFPYHSQHRWVIDRLSSGELGQIQLFRSTFGFPPLDDYNFRYDSTLGGGALLDAGAYTIKAARLYLGADLKLLGAALHMDKQRGVDICGEAQFINNVGQVAQIAFGFNYYYQCRCEWLGTLGKLSLERAFTPPPGYNPVAFVELQDVQKRYVLKSDNYYLNMWRHIRDLLQIKGDFNNERSDILIQSRILEVIRTKAVKI